MADASDSHPVPRLPFGGLPLLAPPRSAWPALQAALQTRRPRRARRAVPWLAAAAVLAAALLLPRWFAPAVAPEPGSGPVAAIAADAPELQALMAESAQLEALLAWGHDENVESGVTASLGSALQDRLEAIDALLSRADLEADTAVPLWQERVLRLRQLAGLESTQQLLAANGEADRGQPVLAF
jgi:hypothetical protein